MKHILKQVLLYKRIPGQLVIQFTDHCNARCPQCGMRVTNKFGRSRLSVDEVKRILDAAAMRGIEVVSFTGGEPMLFADQLAEMIRYAGAVGIKYIRTGTNGFFFANSDASDFESRIRKIAETLAGTPIRNFWISVDSASAEIHETMRGFKGIISGIEKALPIFHDVGIYPSANLGINRNTGGEYIGIGKDIEADEFYEKFKAAFEKFYLFVISLGFTIANACYPMSSGNDGHDLNAVYAATSTDSIVRFSPMEKALLFKALFNVIPKFRSAIRIFSPRASLYALYRQYTDDVEKPYPCRGGSDFFFIDAKDGNVYPCGYRGSENLGRFQDMPSQPCSNDCYLCDWECFRDPSELFGPILHGMSGPIDLLRKMLRDPEYFRLWLEDLKYYRKCSFFDGRKAFV